MHSSSAITWAITWALAAMLAACLGWLWCQRRALHESRARRQETEAHMRLHAALLDHVSVAVLAVDREGRVVYWNRVAETLFGWPVEATIGRPVTELDILPDILPDVPPPTGGFVDVWDGAWDGDGVARHRDGRRFPVRLTGAPLDGAPGRAAALVVTARDLARIGEADPRLTHAAKLAALGELAAGLAHEVSQPLSAARIAAERGLLMLGKGRNDVAAHREVYETIRAQTLHLSEVIERVRSFSRDDGDGADLEPLDPAVPVTDAVTMLRDAFLADGVAIRLEVADGLPPVRGHRGRLAQVIVNLLVNARDAIRAIPGVERGGEGGEIHLSVSADPQGRSVVILVADDGPGIPAEALDRMFDPFFTTKPAERGTGLGLSISLSIVAALGGSIVGWNRERGAAFAVALPVPPGPSTEPNTGPNAGWSRPDARVVAGRAPPAGGRGERPGEGVLA